jgi:enamine deaminase RidA (YjgF/YER057c/UK114 family)
MSKEHLEPSKLFRSERFGFTQVVTSPPGKLVFVSGQVAWDVELKLVGGNDLAKQAERALANLGHALAAAGASPADLTMLRTYILDYKPEYAGLLAPHFSRFLGGAKPPASTWVGVQALAAPGLLIEIEAVAVVPS